MARAITFGSLNLMDTSAHYVRSGGINLSEPGVCELALVIKGTDSDDLADNVQAIEAQLREARKAALFRDRDWVALTLQLGGSMPVYLDITGGEFIKGDLVPGERVLFATLRLQCALYFRGGQINSNNLLLVSNDFSVGTWAKAASAMTSAATTAPDGSTTGWLFAEDATNATHRIYQDVAGLTIGVVYTFSWYAKADVNTLTEGRILDTANTELSSYIFDLSDGTLEATRAAGDGYGIESVGSGWYRCWVKLTATATTHRFALYNWRGGATSHTYVGTVGQGHYIWGAMVNAQSYPGVYMERGTSLTRTNEDIPLYLFGVPGDVPALVRIKSTTTAARMRLGRRTGANLAAASWVPWIDLSAASGAASNADVAQYGDAYISRAITSTTSWSDVATATVGSSDFYRGRFDIFARLYDPAAAVTAPSSGSASVSLGTPTSLSSSITAPSTTTNYTVATAPSIRQSAVGTGSGTGAAPGSVSATWGSATVANNTLLAIIRITATGGDVDSANFYVSAVPAGWTLIAGETSSDTSGQTTVAWLAAKVAGSSESGAKSFTISQSNAAATADNATYAVRLLEIQDCATTGDIVEALSFSSATSGNNFSLSVTTRYENALCLLLAGWAGTPSLVFGAETDYTTNNILVGHRTATESGSQSVTAVASSSGAYTGFLIAINGVLSSSSVPGDNAPGSLATGTYTAYVQAVDTDGNLSNAASDSETTTVAGSTITWSWTAGSGTIDHYKITVVYGGAWYEFESPGTGTSFTLTELTDASLAEVRNVTNVTWTFRVQGVDPSGNVSNASASFTVSTPPSGTKKSLSWTAATGVVSYYLVSAQVNSVVYQFATPDNTTSFSITDVADGKVISALPSTTGAVATPTNFRVTVDGVALDNIVTTSAASQYEVVYMGTADMPPRERMADGTWGTCTVVVQALSGGAASTTVRVDALYLIPHTEPHMVIETSDLTAGDGYLVAETSRRRSHAIAYQAAAEATGTTPTGNCTVAGAMFLEPGQNLLAVLTDGASNANTLADTHTLALDITPCYSWQRGADYAQSAP